MPSHVEKDLSEDAIEITVIEDPEELLEPELPDPIEPQVAQDLPEPEPDTSETELLPQPVAVNPPLAKTEPVEKVSQPQVEPSPEPEPARTRPLPPRTRRTGAEARSQRSRRSRAESEGARARAES